MVSTESLIDQISNYRGTSYWPDGYLGLLLDTLVSQGPSLAVHTPTAMLVARPDRTERSDGIEVFRINHLLEETTVALVEEGEAGEKPLKTYAYTGVTEEPVTTYYDHKGEWAI